MSHNSKDLVIRVQSDLHARPVAMNVRNILGEEISRKLITGKPSFYDYCLLGARKDSFSFWERGGYGSLIRYTNYGRVQSIFRINSSELVTLALLDKILEWFVEQHQFLQAVLQDRSYTSEQNEEQVGISEVAQVPEPDCPIIWDGSSGPHSKRYNTTGNPGYSCSHEGYWEEVAAFMWLSRTFFERSGADRDEVLNTPWLETKVLENDVIELKAWEHCFDSPEEPQRSRQFALRQLLYPNAVAAREKELLEKREKTKHFLAEFVESHDEERKEEIIKHIIFLAPDMMRAEHVLQSDILKSKRASIDFDLLADHIFYGNQIESL